MRTADSKVDLDDDGVEAPSPPQEFRCPTLELMRDPVVASSGQTYDRESITRWFGSGKSTCPKTGQVLADLTCAQQGAQEFDRAVVPGERHCREAGR